MHFDEQLLASLSEDELEDTLNWTRNREKEYRRRGDFGLSHYWAALSLDIVGEMGRRYSNAMELTHEQLSLRISPRIEPDSRRA